MSTIIPNMDGELAVLEQRREKTRPLTHAMMQEPFIVKTRNL